MKFGFLFVCLLSGVVAGFAEGAKPLSATLGQQFKLTLPSNRTTGYSWQLSRPLDKAKVKLLAHKYQRSATRPMGAGGQETWIFKAVGSGDTTIALQYVRPWEKGVKPAQTTNVPVTISTSKPAR